jgi:hypothetical protein
MAEECIIKGPAERECQPHCAATWKAYKGCEERINTYDTWDFHKLQHLAEHHGVPIHDNHKVTT